MKKILLVVLLIIPFVVYADGCDRNKHKDFLQLSQNITYDNSYSKSSSSFKVTIYNVIDEMYAKYNKKTYNPSKDNTIVIDNIPEGKEVNINIYGKDNCSEIKNILIIEPYFNNYYESDLCLGYENALVMCSSQFTSVKVTKSVLERSIYNYEHSISNDTEIKKEEVEDTFISKLTDFATSWGIRIALAVISTIFSIALFNDKYRKVKHGI